jgi:hypothetical protein
MGCYCFHFIDPADCVVQKKCCRGDVAGNRTAQWQVREIFIEAKKQINNKELFYWH